MPDGDYMGKLRNFITAIMFLLSALTIAPQAQAVGDDPITLANVRLIQSTLNELFAATGFRPAADQNLPFPACNGKYVSSQVQFAYDMSNGRIVEMKTSKSGPWSNPVQAGINTREFRTGSVTSTYQVFSDTTFYKVELDLSKGEVLTFPINPQTRRIFRAFQVGSLMQSDPSPVEVTPVPEPVVTVTTSPSPKVTVQLPKRSYMRQLCANPNTKLFGAVLMDSCVKLAFDKCLNYLKTNSKPLDYDVELYLDALMKSIYGAQSNAIQEQALKVLDDAFGKLDMSDCNVYAYKNLGSVDRYWYNQRSARDKKLLNSEEEGLVSEAEREYSRLYHQCVEATAGPNPTSTAPTSDVQLYWSQNCCVCYRQEMYDPGFLYDNVACGERTINTFSYPTAKFTCRNHDSEKLTLAASECKERGAKDRETFYRYSDCNRSTCQPAPTPTPVDTKCPGPDFGKRFGICLPSCGKAGGNICASSTDSVDQARCANHELIFSYDCPTCCSDRPKPTPATTCPAKYKLIKGVCVPYCEAAGGDTCDNTSVNPTDSICANYPPLQSHDCKSCCRVSPQALQNPGAASLGLNSLPSIVDSLLRPETPLPRGEVCKAYAMSGLNECLRENGASSEDSSICSKIAEDAFSSCDGTSTEHRCALKCAEKERACGTVIDYNPTSEPLTFTECTCSLGCPPDLDQVTVSPPSPSL